MNHAEPTTTLATVHRTRVPRHAEESRVGENTTSFAALLNGAAPSSPVLATRVRLAPPNPRAPEFGAAEGTRSARDDRLATIRQWEREDAGRSAPSRIAAARETPIRESAAVRTDRSSAPSSRESVRPDEQEAPASAAKPARSALQPIVSPVETEPPQRGQVDLPSGKSITPPRADPTDDQSSKRPKPTGNADEATLTTPQVRPPAESSRNADAATSLSVAGGGSTQSKTGATSSVRPVATEAREAPSAPRVRAGEGATAGEKQASSPLPRRTATANRGPTQQAMYEKIASLAKLRTAASPRMAYLQMNPPSLGPLRVSMDVVQDAVRLRFSTEDPEARELLWSQVDDLESALSRQGLRLERVEFPNLGQGPVLANPFGQGQTGAGSTQQGSGQRDRERSDSSRLSQAASGPDRVATAPTMEESLSEPSRLDVRA